MVSLFCKKNEHGGVEIYSKMPFLEKPVADIWKDENADSAGLQEYLTNLFLNSPQMSRALSRLYGSLEKNRHADFLQDYIIDLLDIFDEEISPEYIKTLSEQSVWIYENEE